MSEESSYMVFTEDGQQHGPFPKHRVLELLERGFIDENAEVEHPTAGRSLLPLHPHFAGVFIEGDSRNADFMRSRALRSQRTRRLRGRRRMRGIWRGVGWVVVLALGALAVLHRGDIKTSLQSVFSGANPERGPEGTRSDLQGSGGRVSGGDEEQRQAFIAALGEPSRDASGSAVEHLEQGWRRVVSQGLRADEQARQHMESAVRLSDAKPWALVGLIAVEFLGEPVERIDQDRASMALELLRQSGSPGDVALAESIKAFSSKDYGSSLESARSCLELRPGHSECALMATIASGREGRPVGEVEAVLGTAMASYPESLELRVWEQRIAFERGEFNSVRRALAGLGRPAEKLPVYQGLSASIEERLGNWTAARKGYAKQFEMDPTAIESGLKAAVILYQVEGLLQRARNLLVRLGERDGLSSHQRSMIAMHAAHAARMDGEPRQAIRLAEVEKPSILQRRYLALAQAMAYADLGDNKAVDARIVEMNETGFKGREAARYHAWLVRYYLATDRVQLALWALENARGLDPHWGALAALAIEIEVRVGNLSKLPKLLEETVGQDLAQDAMRTPWSNIPHLGGKDEGFLRVLSSTLKGNVYYADTVGLVSGVWLLAFCEDLANCGAAEEFLLSAKKGEKQTAVAQMGLLHLYAARNEWGKIGDILSDFRPSRHSTAAHLAFQGAYFESEGKLDDALKAYRQVERLLPKSSWGSRALARVYQKLGDRRSFRAALAGVRRLDPNDSVTGALSFREGVAWKKTTE